ncbi:MAG: hypothetical protein WC794_00205 [Candidatus Doudnabacteria bacterium]|jgi:rod shape-determining protein MreD
MKYLIYTIAITLLLGINLGLFGNLPFFGQTPNLLFLLTFYFALEKKDLDFFFIAFVSGLFLDFFSVHFFGGYTIALLVTASLLYLFTQNFILQDINWKFLIGILLGSMAVARILLWFYAVSVAVMHLAPETDSLKVYFSDFTWSFLYNLLLMYPIYFFYGYLRKLVDLLTVKRRGIGQQ